MAKLILEITDVDDDTGAIAVRCSADVDIETAKITPAIIIMSEIIAALQEEQTVPPTKAKAH